LVRGLLGRVPLPPGATAAAAGGVFEGEEDEVEDEGVGSARRRRLLQEVTGFVEDLLSLLQTRYLVSPVNARRETPADVVGARGAMEETHQGA